MRKSVATYEFEVALEDVDSHEFYSSATMLDYDIVLMRPHFDEFIPRNVDHYNGKPCLDDHRSFIVKDSCQHWRREVTQALEANKTIFVFLRPKLEIHVATGNTKESGTGRNARVTRFVETISNYSMLPLELSVTNAVGLKIKLTEVGKRFAFGYKDLMGDDFGYLVQIASSSKTAIVPWFTAAGTSIVVGGLISFQKSRGALILLPDIDFSADGFHEVDDAGEEAWSNEGRQFCSSFVNEIISIDASWRAEGEKTQEPAWATQSTYSLPKEQSLNDELLAAEQKAEKARAKVEALKDELADAGRFRSLLFEKGKPLEIIIIASLKLLGFEASPFREGESEFDVVFECDEGRLLGEAEGKDNKAINIDKLRQLSMNINEDLARDEVATPAKGVLFGNGFRLMEPKERPAQFTEKCISAATGQSMALVSTTELFLATRYLVTQSDDEYRSRCRRALLAGSGVVSFPKPPEAKREEG